MGTCLSVSTMDVVVGSILAQRAASVYRTMVLLGRTGCCQRDVIHDEISGEGPVGLGTEDEFDGRIDAGPAFDGDLHGQPVATRQFDVGPLDRRGEQRVAGHGVDEVNLQTVTTPEIPAEGAHVDGGSQAADAGGDFDLLADGGDRELDAGHELAEKDWPAIVDAIVAFTASAAPRG